MTSSAISISHSVRVPVPSSLRADSSVGKVPSMLQIVDFSPRSWGSTSAANDFIAGGNVWLYRSYKNGRNYEALSSVAVEISGVKHE
ncbi:Hypothetical protein NTJ_06571 [Nesidiocoris tenuis]|uniref:Uncharacterized protein n=1 Tax=Nesidiocoris tenuis TaxID=355587 RepID=A0ABN7ANG0_9HEMI|nr:Hypothetical protein NTJ_06571 [Nesidiocoris tenuis]